MYSSGHIRPSRGHVCRDGRRALRAVAVAYSHGAATLRQLDRYLGERIMTIEDTKDALLIGAFYRFHGAIWLHSDGAYTTRDLRRCARRVARRLA